MNSKAITKSAVALAIVAIILVAGLVGTLAYYTTLPSPSSVATTAVGARTPGFVSTNTYVEETGNQFQWLDPAVAYFEFDWQILANQYEKLLWYNGNSTTELIPWLASSYSQSSPTQYVFHLRQNITFQDGTPFNARAVWFSLNRLLIIDGTSGSGDAGTQAAWIIQQVLNTSLSTTMCCTQAHDAHWVQEVLGENFVQIVDPYTVKINIETPTSQFPFLISNEWADIYSPSFVVSHDFPSACASSDCPADTINYVAYFDHIAGDGSVKDNYLNLPVQGSKAGSGPYYIDSVNPTTFEIVMKKNPNYWGGPSNWSGPPIKASLTELDIEYVPDLSTRLLDIKAGKATSIDVSPSDIYSVADRNAWIQNDKLVSVLPGVTLYGPYPQLENDFFNFITNVTDSAGSIRSFQPFADVRWRLAVADSVNMTDALINIDNRLGETANQLVPPGTAPVGTYDPSLTDPWSFNLDEMKALIADACAHPLTSFVDVNGHPYPKGTIDNSCNPDNPQLIELYVPSADQTSQRILTVMAGNLNKVSSSLGVTFTIAPIPHGQDYTLASKHQIYFYWSRWTDDYNHVIDWLAPMFLAGGALTAWNNMNYTTLNNLYSRAAHDDATGNTQDLVTVSDQIQQYGNNAVMYFYIAYPIAYYVKSSFLQGFYYNQAVYVTYYATEYYTQTPS